MKLFVVCAMTLAIMQTSLAAEIPEEFMELKEDRENSVRINAVSDRTVRNDAREKLEVISFFTNQNEDDKLIYKVRVTVEITDKSGDVYYARIVKGQGALDEEYKGEDEWAFQIPHGELERPKITAYAIQYGFVKDKMLIPVYEEFDDVDSAEEIVERADAGRLEMKITKHTYQYLETAGENEGQVVTSFSNHLSLK